MKNLAALTVLTPFEIWSEEFDDFDTEIFTTSLVEAGEEIKGFRLNLFKAIRDPDQKSHLAIGLSPNFSDVADLGNKDNLKISTNLKYGNENGNTSLKVDAQPQNDDKVSRFVWGFKWQISSKLESGLHITPAILGLDNNGWSIMLQRTDKNEIRQLVNKLTVAGGNVYAQGVLAFDYRLEYEDEIGQWTVLAELNIEIQSKNAGDNLSVELEPALQRDLGWLFLRGSMGLGVAGDNKPDDISLKLTMAKKVSLY